MPIRFEWALALFARPLAASRLTVLGFAVTLLAAPLLAQPPQPPEPPAEVHRQEALEALEDALDEFDEQIDEQIDEQVDSGDVRDSLRRERALREAQRARETARRTLRRSLRNSRSDSKVAFGSSIHVAPDEVARDLVVIGGSIHVEGEVQGDCVAVGGSIAVDGKVLGNVVAIGGRVVLGENAEVLGEATSVGAGVDRAEGAEVLGGVNDIDIGSGLTLNLEDWDWDWGGLDHDLSFLRWGNAFGLAWELTKLVLALLLCSFVLLIGGTTIERIHARMVATPWTALFVGLATLLLFLPVLIVVSLILTVSIIGIPLMLILVLASPLLFFGTAIVGFTAVALCLGRWLGGRFGWGTRSPYAELALGLVVIASLAIVGDMLGLFGGPVVFFALMFAFAGGVVKFGVWTMGLGAVVLHVFASRRRAAPSAVPAYGSLGDEPLPPLPAGTTDDGGGADPGGSPPAGAVE